MTLPILRADALSLAEDAFTLRLSLPWIRSLPVSSVRELAIDVDGRAAEVRVRLGGRLLPPHELVEESGWWHVQDRLVLEGALAPAAGPRTVAVAFELLIPYLPGGPDRPLVLPFREEAALTADIRIPSVSRDAA